METNAIRDNIQLSPQGECCETDKPAVQKGKGNKAANGKGTRGKAGEDLRFSSLSFSLFLLIFFSRKYEDDVHFQELNFII